MGMVLAELFQPATGGITFAVVLGLTILSLNRFRRQGNDFVKVRVDDDRAEHLVVVRNFAVFVRPRHAVLAGNLGGAEVFHAVEGHQVTAFHEDIIFQNLAALELAKDVLESGTEFFGGNLVEDLTHLGVAGNARQAEDRMEVVVQRAATEGQQRGILQGKDSEAGHQGVGQGKRRAATLLRKGLEALANTLDQGVEVQMAAWTPLGSRLAHGNPSGRAAATQIVYEKHGRRSGLFKLFSARRELLSGGRGNRAYCYQGLSYSA